MPSVTDFFEVLDRLESRDVMVVANRCIMTRNRNVGCHACADACTSDAITINPDNGSLDVDASNCIGCGTCSTVCPTSAIVSHNPSDKGS